MSSDPGRSADGVRSSDPPTDPMLPAIAEEDVLAPLECPRVPELDDRTLARMLAELDGEDAVPPEPHSLPRQRGAEVGERPGENPAEAMDDSPPGRGRAERVDDWPASQSPAEVGEGRPSQSGAVIGEARPDQRPAVIGEARADQSCAEPGGECDPERGDEPGLDADDEAVAPRRQTARYPRPSAYGPVIPSPYGEHRPPVLPGTEEPITLTGLSPLSRGKLGSRLFALAFVAIFVIIVVQTLVSLFSM